jgi:Cof subfamily protein (haloacid dehalogenase superfamily)
MIEKGEGTSLTFFEPVISFFFNYNQLMQKPIICFDFDGTLVNHEGRMHPKDKAILQSEDLPAYFITATGRSLEAVHSTFIKHELFEGEPFPFPSITLNGGQVSDAGGKSLAYFPFEIETQHKVIELTEGFPSVTFLLLDQFNVYLVDPDEIGRQRAAKYEMYPIPYAPWFKDMSFCKLMCLSEEHDSLLKIAELASDFQVESAFSMQTIFELTPLGVNKGSSLSYLINVLKLEGVPLYAAGDGGNDLAMLELADVSFTADTSPEYICQAVDYVIDVEQEGLLTPILKTLPIF